MSAPQAFQIGDRVRISRFGRARFVVRDPDHWEATVVGFGAHSPTVRVRCEGRKTIQSFHVDFLEHASESAGGEAS